METVTINQLIQEIKELKDLLKEKESEKLVYTTKELRWQRHKQFKSN